MTIYGTFKNFINRNEKNGYSAFEIKTSDGTVGCLGHAIQKYIPKTPLRIEGEYNDYGEYSVQNIKACGYDREVMLEYLKTANFKDVGEERAKIIIDTYGEDLFGLAEKEEITGSTEYEARIFAKLYEIVKFDELLGFLKQYDGGYMDARRITNGLGAKQALENLKKNPFTCHRNGLPLEICEKIGQGYSIKPYDHEKTRAYVRDAIDTNRKNGNTRLSFKELCNMVAQKEKRYHSEHIKKIFIAEEILGRDFILDEKEDTVYIYTKDDYIEEHNIAKHMRRLNFTKVKYPEYKPAALVKRDIKYSPEQEKTFDILASSGVKIIYGGPGTGKTTIMNDILDNYGMLHPGHTILLCAPTGRAARRMQELTGRKAETIHRMLKVRPGERYTRIEQLGAECIVVDESSMVDTWMMSVLLSSIKDGSTVIFIGDNNQLSSVGPGNVLGDMLKSEYAEKYQLKTIFRQKGINGIVENSNRVINGQYPLVPTESFMIKECKSEEDVCYGALSLAKELRNRKIPFRVITPVKKTKFKSSTYNINREIQQMTVDTSQKDVIYGYNRFYVGDEVIFTRNNYEVNGNEYYNGQEGIITDIQKHSGNIYITVSNGDESVVVMNENIDDLELGYAITAHKSQGGECNNVIILVPEKPYGLLKKQLLYVEITRAKKTVWIFAEKDAIRTAVSDQHEFSRNTGLCELI